MSLSHGSNWAGKGREQAGLQESKPPRVTSLLEFQQHQDLRKTKRLLSKWVLIQFHQQNKHQTPALGHCKSWLTPIFGVFLEKGDLFWVRSGFNLESGILQTAAPKRSFPNFVANELPCEWDFRNHCKCHKPELLHCSGRVGAHPVQFVDEGEEGDVVTLHLPVDSDGLALDTSHSTQNQDGSIQHPQRPLHFNGEVHVSWITNTHRNDKCIGKEQQPRGPH